MLRFLLAYLLLCPLQGFAELYKWTDEQGRVHFGDRPPPSQAVESVDIKVQNNDFELLSEESAEYFNRVRKNQAISEQKQQQAAQQQNTAQAQRCQKARESLEKLQGPVVFYDKEGNTYDIPEKEREAKAKKLEKEIQRYCG